MKTRSEEIMASVHKDITGLPVTCSRVEALEWFNKGLVAYVAVRENSVPYFKKALELDDKFTLAHCIMVNTYTCGAVTGSINLSQHVLLLI